VVQASATLILLTAAGLLAGVLRLLAGLLAAALLMLTGLILAALLLVALVLVALVLTAALLARIVLIVLVHHVLSCCLAPQRRRLRSKGSNHVSINASDVGTVRHRCKETS
jgi:membrane protein implicated in regulation of membrane protease activity